MEPVRKSASWTREGTAEDALDALVSYARTHNGRARVDASQVTIRFGSRLAARFMGLATWRIPHAVRVSVTASDQGRAQLTAEGYSDAGWYIYRTESATLTYERLIGEKLNELQKQ